MEIQTKNQEMLLLVIEEGAGMMRLLCGNSHEGAMLQEFSNPGLVPGAACSSLICFSFTMWAEGKGDLWI